MPEEQPSLTSTSTDQTTPKTSSIASDKNQDDLTILSNKDRATVVDVINWVLNDLDSWDGDDYDPTFERNIQELAKNMGLELGYIVMEID